MRFELAVRKNIQHFTGRGTFVVTELGSGEDLFDVDTETQARTLMAELIRSQPQKYFSKQEIDDGR